MKRSVPGLLAGLVATAALAAPAHAGPTVTVRVEGASSTLLERTTVTLPDKDTIVCGTGGAASVADALDIATGGAWDRQEQINTILGETHDFVPDSDYWALWNGRGGTFTYSNLGACSQVMAEGDEALFLVDTTPPPDFESSGFATALRGVPASVGTGTPVPVTVVVFAADGTTAPVAGATISGGGTTATTAADGTATLRFPQPGSFTVKATKAGTVPTGAEPVTVTATPGAPAVPSAPTGASGAPDTTPPVATIAGLERGKVFTRRTAPRELSGTVTADASGLMSVRLAISRRKGRRCWVFDGGSERFERHRCGGSRSFRIGDRADWSYLLPKRLPRGRYTIRVVAIDNAGNDAATETVIRVR